MPVMDGLEMTGHIKKQHPDVKVIVMSAYSIKEYFLEAINLGVNGYLIKPVEAKKLFALIDDLAKQILMSKELAEKEEKRRIAEENLKRSLAEKDILLREVHHRVKNNMQIISSILKMQQRQIDDPALKVVLEESQNRIRSMALIHENLYQNENLANITFANYIKSLAGNLARTFDTVQRKVSFEYDIEDIYLPIDTGIPCGLIINELLSNAFKYAFIGKDKGTISIALKQTAEQDYRLTVADNGRGLPDDLNIDESATLGMKIVSRLVQQIDGSLQYKFSNGAMFIIDFKI
jgi:two-component sensor histidine kinase